MASKISVYKNIEKRTYDITEAKRAEYRKISQASRLAKLAAEQGLLEKLHPVNSPRFDPNKLMPKLLKHGLTSLSLFSGGGGLDLGFDQAGYEHVMHAADYGVPQIRKRVIFVGFREKTHLKRFCAPQPTHQWGYLGAKNTPYTPSLFLTSMPKTFGVRAALGLADTGYDNLAPTIRSAFTGKRNTTSILNSAAGQKSWATMSAWPNGVQINREKASAFPAKNAHFRLSVQDVALLQGFPEDWQFAGAVYQRLGQIGNAVAPPIAYQVACHVLHALSPTDYSSTS